MQEQIPKKSRFDTRDRGENSKVDEMMTDLSGRMGKVIEELTPEIKRGEYGLILGVDASGRLPTLVLEGVIKKIYEKDDRHIETRFIAGSRHLSLWMKDKKFQDIGAYLDSLSLDISKKVLIVDDTISTGESIELICAALYERGLHFDIASATITSYAKDSREIAKQLKADRMVIGGMGVSPVWEAYSLSGVVRKNTSDLFASPSGTWKRWSNEARMDVKEIAEELYRKYEELNHEE